MSADVKEVVGTIIVPTRHEERNVGPLLQRIHHAHGGRHGVFEVLVVDDSDNHATVAAVDTAAHSLRSSRLLVGHYHRPQGPERWGGLAGAVVDGIQRAKGDVVLVMDGDGQHPAEIAPEMIERVKAGTDLVVASRYREGGSNDGLDGPMRKAVSMGATLLTRFLFPKTLRGVTDPMTGFFALRRDQLDMERLAGARGFKILFEILARHTHLERDEVPLQFAARHDGESKSGEGNGREFIMQLLKLRVATLPPLVHFLIGGGLGAVLGAVLLWVMVHLGINPLVANAAQLGATLVFNFGYNKRVTWRRVEGESLRYQMTTFGVTRGITLVIGWLVFAGLMALAARADILSTAWSAQAANAASLAVMTVVNWYTSKHLVFRPKAAAVGKHHRRRVRRISRIPLPLVATLTIVAGTTLAVIGYAGFINWLVGLMVVYAIFGLTTSSLEVSWRLYGRRTPEAHENMKFPPAVSRREAKHTVTVMVPALDEASVIQGTLERLAQQTHPHVTIVATLVEGDTATLAAAQKAVASYPDRIRIVSRPYQKGSKAQQLNHALTVAADGEIVGIFDAEDQVPPELLLHIEAMFEQTGADIIQVGAQLVNLDLRRHNSWNRLKRWPWLNKLLRPFFMSWFWAVLRGWFCALNCLEYLFWWSSRVFFQIMLGFVPLGGVGVFAKRDMLAKIGGWPDTLTEDCALGVKASVRHKVKIVAAYDPELAIREETPPRMFGKGGWFRQRRRWIQGFLYELRHGEWRKLPTLKERMMALYILGMPFIQSTNAVMLPVGIAAAMLLNVSVGLTMLMYLPFIPLAMSIIFQLVGLREFSRQFGQKAKFRHYVWVSVLNLPYQWLQAAAAVSAIWRELTGKRNWDLTARLADQDLESVAD